MEELIQFMTAHGFQFTPVCDGKVHRFGRGGSSSKDNAWFIGFQNHAMDSGEVYIVAQMGDWKTGELLTFKPSGTKVTRDEMGLIQKRIDAAREAVERERIEKQDAAADKAERTWKGLKDTGPTQYTAKKKTTYLNGTRRDEYNNLVIPMRDVDGKLWGLQRIAEDGSKKFSSGQRVKGSFFVIGADSLEGLDEIYLCEGWATGTSIHMATKVVAACAFNAGNLVDAAKEIKTKYPLLRITVAGDADDVGREKAAKAAVACSGSTVFPEGPGSDFNDMHVAAGLEALTEFLCGAVVDEKGYIPLGFNGTTYYFYLNERKDVLATSSFNEVHMFAIAPREHWQERFPSKTGTDWGAARNYLVGLGGAVGPFDPARVRGTGVWLDKGRTVVNSGYELLVDGKAVPSSKFKSRYIYIQTQNRFPITEAAGLTVEECQPIINFAKHIAFARPDLDASLLLGWLAIARIAGALPIRPHLWITGGKGTGKSTLMEQFIYPLLGGPYGKFYIQGGSTEAGIRQTLGASSRPLIMDEAEITDQKSRQLIVGIQDLNRQAWSPSKGTVVKGSANGQAIEFQLNYCALMASIRVVFTNDADESRYSVLELHKPKLNAAEMAQLLEPITEELGERLFKRSYSMILTIRASYQTLFRAISAVKGNRVAQQNAILLAGFYALQSDTPISDDEARAVACDMRFTEALDADEPEEDCRACLNHLLTSRVRLSTGSGETAEQTVGEVLQSGLEWQKRELRNYGILIGPRGKLIIANRHAELAKLFNGTHWYNWGLSLARLDGAVKLGSTRFGSTVQRAIQVPVTD